MKYKVAGSGPDSCYIFAMDRYIFPMSVPGATKTVNHITFLNIYVTTPAPGSANFVNVYCRKLEYLGPGSDPGPFSY